MMDSSLVGFNERQNLSSDSHRKEDYKILSQKIDAAIKQMNSLMIRTRNPFIEQYEDGQHNVRWIQRKYTLTDNVVRAHVLGDRTVGIYYANESTVFLVFDVDAEGDATGQEIRVRGIVHALRKSGIPEGDVHVMFSGMKGYHVQLFWDGPLKINSVTTFGRSIVRQLNDYATGVELRPESVNGRAVKLPLAFHKKSGMNAMYVDRDTLEPVPDSTEYFLRILPMDTEVVLKAIAGTKELERIRRAEHFTNKSLEQFGLEPVEERKKRAERDFADMKMPISKKSGLRDKVERLLTDGLPSKGTRHQSQFLVALYLKDSNVSMDEARVRIREWITAQWINGKTNETDLNFLQGEAERCVKYVYGKDDYIGLFDSRGRRPEMTYDDAIFAARFRDPNVRRVVWAYLMIGRMYHESGEFFVPQESIVQMTGLSRPTVSKITQLLIDNGYLKVIEEWKYTLQRARTYHMEHLAANPSDDSPTISTLPDDSVASLYQWTIRIIDRLNYDIAI